MPRINEIFKTHGPEIIVWGSSNRHIKGWQEHVGMLNESF